MQPYLPDKPVSWIASLFRGLMKEYSCDYRVFTRKIYMIRGKLKNLKKKRNKALLHNIWTLKFLSLPCIM